MIPDQWYALLDSRQVPRRRPVGVTRLGEKLVFFRDAAGQVACLRDRCAHRGAALSLGECHGDAVACPFHGFAYDASGRCTLIPAHGAAAAVPERMKVLSYPARVAHGFVWVWWGAARPDLPPVPFFEDLDDRYLHTGFRDTWPVHYSRAIENQLDVMHLPFVHRTTIGRGGRPVVVGPVVQWLGPDRLRFHVFNRADDGTPPRPPEACEPSALQVYLDFQFPNLWQNVLGERVRIVVAFAPVDQDSTVLYLRTYQRVVRLPGLRHLFHLVMNRTNRIILGQDRRVVLSQEPRASALRMDEQLVQGDRPIVEYRRRRQALIDQAAV